MTQNLYDMPMTYLGHYPINDPHVHFDGPQEHYSFEHNGITFWGDDTVVVDGVIGNVEIVNTDTGYVGLGLSFNHDVLSLPEHLEWSSGHRCKLDGIRHATDEEKALYEEKCNRICDIFEESDRKWKERFLNF